MEEEAMRAAKRALAIVMAIAVCTAIAPEAGAKGRGRKFGYNRGVVPMIPYLYGNLAQKWTEWMNSIPSGQHPVLDETGEYAGVGQHGPVWFLAGTFGGTAYRECSVPAGKMLFFPIMNKFWVSITEGTVEPELPVWEEPFSVPGAKEHAWEDIQMDPNAELTVEIDGKPLCNLHAYLAGMECPFSVWLPEESPWDDFVDWVYVDGEWEYRPENEARAGVYPDCLANGYWLLLKPLSKGEHTIHLKGVDTTNGWFTEVYYTLSVE
jgi:hypothetical protein